MMAHSVVILLALYIFLSVSPHLTIVDAFSLGHGIVLPKNPYGFIKENLTLTCRVTDTNITGDVSGRMYFTRQVDDVEETILSQKFVEILGSHSIRLEYPVKSGEYQGSYHCCLNTMEDNALNLDSRYVTLDYRPVAVEKVECQVYNWQTLTCTWDLNQHYNNMDHIKVQLIWSLRTFNDVAILRRNGSKCPHQNLTSCKWKVYDGSNSFQSGKMYHMTVIVTTHTMNRIKVAEAESQIFDVDTLVKVKPAPVENLTVEDKNSTCISLTWQHSEKYRDMLCRLSVRGRHQIHRKYTDIKEKSKTVCGLHPAWKYKLKVSCIPLVKDDNKPKKPPRKCGTYSDWTSIDHETLEDVPSGVPELSTGSFKYNGCLQPSVCSVIIYWRPVSENESNGEITHYKLKQTDIVTGEEREFNMSGGQRSKEVMVKSDRNYLIQLKARTRIGYQTNSSSIVLQSLNDRLPFPSDFLVEAHDNTLDISWGPPRESGDTPRGRNIGYTLYYCNGSKFTFRCMDEIILLPLSRGDRLHELTISKETVDHTLIGISSEMEIANHIVSSGILWNLCTYKRKINLPEPKNVRFSLEQPDNALRVLWDKFDCSKNPVYVTQYIISYCTANSQGGCAVPSVNVTIPNTEVSHMIEDLKAGVSYRVTLLAVSKAGPGPESEAIILEVTNNDLNTGQIIGIFIACLLVSILLLTAVFYFCNKVWKMKREFYYPVKIPPLPLGWETNHHKSDLKKSKPNVTKGDNNNSKKRNISVSSQTALLLNMEEDVQKGDQGKSQNPVTLPSLHSVMHKASYMDQPSSRGSRKLKTKTDVKGANSCNISGTSARENNTIDSYIEFGNLSDSPCPSSTSSSSGRPLLDYSNRSQPPHRLTQGPQLDAHIGFVLNPPPPSDPPAPTPAPTRGTMSPQPQSGNISYVTDFPAFARQHDMSDCSPVLLYSKIGSDGSLTPPGNPGYVLHDQVSPVASS